MKRLRIFLNLLIVLPLTPLVSQDTVLIHLVKLSVVGTEFKVDGNTVVADVYKKFEDEQKSYKEKATGDKPCWLRLVKQNQLVEQGLFCRITPVGNHFKYDEKGKLVYKMIYTKSMAKLSCAKPDFTGTEATEEVYDKNGFKIFGTYKDGLKQGRWLYYDNTNAIIGYEDFEKGQSRLRKGKVFTNRADGGFDIAKN